MIIYVSIFAVRGWSVTLCAVLLPQPTPLYGSRINCVYTTIPHHPAKTKLHIDVRMANTRTFERDVGGDSLLLWCIPLTTASLSVKKKPPRQCKRKSSEMRESVVWHQTTERVRIIEHRFLFQQQHSNRLSLNYGLLRLSLTVTRRSPPRRFINKPTTHTWSATTQIWQQHTEQQQQQQRRSNFTHVTAESASAKSLDFFELKPTQRFFLRVVQEDYFHSRNTLLTAAGVDVGQ